MTFDKILPSIYDLDAGNDVDDSIVALLVSRHPNLYNPVLIVTNDETEHFSRANFVSNLISNVGRYIEVAAGLRCEGSPEKLALPNIDLVDNLFEKNGIERIINVIENTDDKVNYFGMGALTNLSTVLDLRPEFAEKINLIQMGGALKGVYRKPDDAQYNVRLDPRGFGNVMKQLEKPTLLMSHTSWGPFEKDELHPLGFYKESETFEALKTANNGDYDILIKQLDFWFEKTF